MTTDLQDWDEDLAIDPEEEYQGLLNGLRRSEGFGLFFVQCSPFSGGKLIERVRADLSEKALEVLTLDRAVQGGNFFKRVQEFLSDKPQTEVLFIQGLENSLFDAEETKSRLGWSEKKINSRSWRDIPLVLINLNQQRERFRDCFSLRFVFLLPQFAIKYLVHRAPDFFDWRSGLFEYASDSETLSEEAERILEESDYQAYCSWSAEERKKRILELQAIAEEGENIPNTQARLFFEQGLLFDAAEEFAIAIASYDRAIDIKPDDREAWNNRGNTLRKLERYEDAIASFDRAIELKPDYHEAWYNRGLALSDLKRHEDAIASYDRAIEIKPDKYEAWDNRGDALRNLKRYEDAIASYDRAIEIKPDYHYAWSGRGRAFFELGRYEDAIASYDRAIEIEPDKYEAWDNRGDALSELERYEDAIASYDRATDIKPDYHYAWDNRGDALSKLGRYEDAIASYDRAIEIKPDYLYAWNGRGLVLSSLERYEEALICYERATEIDPDHGLPVYNKACCYGLQGKADQAVETLTAAVDLYSGCRIMAQTDTDFDPIRTDLRFQTLISTDTN